jgi:hypothetical protein
MTDTTAKSKVKTTKRSREFEVIQSDRILLIDAANQLVCSLSAKQNSVSDSGVVVEIPLTEKELSAYNSALDFLTRQFHQGYSHSEPMEKKVETEETYDSDD